VPIAIEQLYGQTISRGNGFYDFHHGLLEICYGSAAALDLSFGQEGAKAEITIRAVAAFAAR
jgi:hypothetical protein